MNLKLNIIRVALWMAITLSAGALLSCNSVNDERIPNMRVSINLGDAGLWNQYGVAGFGISRNFIPELKEPSGFAYSASSGAGFGGVLLIGGMDPFTGDTNVPLAYDLACPVECKPSVRVKVDNSTFEAICPECGSKYDVTMRGGAPISGPAADKNHRYGLRRYNCIPSQYGGYIIVNR